MARRSVATISVLEKEYLISLAWEQIVVEMSNAWKVI